MDSTDVALADIWDAAEISGETCSRNNRRQVTAANHDLALRKRDLEARKAAQEGLPITMKMGNYREVSLYRLNGSASLGGTCLRESESRVAPLQQNYSASAVVACEVLGRLHCAACKQVEEREEDLARAKAENLDLKTSIAVHRLLKLCPELSVSRAVEITRDTAFQGQLMVLPRSRTSEHKSQNTKVNFS